MSELLDFIPFQSRFYVLQNFYNVVFSTGVFLRHAKMGVIVKRCAEEFPLLDIESSLQPITRTVLRIKLYVKANFRY